MTIQIPQAYEEVYKLGFPENEYIGEIIYVLQFSKIENIKNFVYLVKYGVYQPEDGSTESYYGLIYWLDNAWVFLEEER